MTVIELSPRLINPLQVLAKRQEASVEEIVEGLIDRFLREQRHVQLFQEMERFQEQHSDLLPQYRGRFVSMLDGQVLDNDVDGGALYARLTRQYGDAPVLIVELTDEPDQEFKRLSRRLML